MIQQEKAAKKRHRQENTSRKEFKTYYGAIIGRVMLPNQTLYIPYYIVSMFLQFHNFYIYTLASKVILNCTLKEKTVMYLAILKEGDKIKTFFFF